MVFHLHPRYNGALNINPSAADAQHASGWLWTVFGVMLLSCIVAFGWWCSSPEHNKLKHLAPLVVLPVATITYLIMALNRGWIAVRSGFDGHPTRQVFLVRYIMYAINAPTILLSLLSYTSLPTPRKLLISFFSLLLVICGLIGALITGPSKWAFYTFGLVFLVIIWCMLFGYVRLFEFQNQAYRTCYFRFAACISFAWMLYAIGWALSEGVRTFSPTAEMIFYGVLDLLSAPAYFLVYAVCLDKLDARALGRQPQQQPVPAAQKATRPKTRNQVSSPAARLPLGQPSFEVQSEQRRDAAVQTQPQGARPLGQPPPSEVQSERRCDAVVQVQPEARTSPAAELPSAQPSPPEVQSERRCDAAVQAQPEGSGSRGSEAESSLRPLRRQSTAPASRAHLGQYPEQIKREDTR